MELILCKVCGSKVNAWQSEKHLMIKKHMKKMTNDDENEKAEVDWRRCCQWHAHRKLDMYDRENETCNVCLDKSRQWGYENSERMRETKERYRGTHREEIKE